VKLQRQEEEALLSGYYVDDAPNNNTPSSTSDCKAKCKCKCTGRGLFGFLSVLATAVGVIALAFVLIIRNDAYPFTHVGSHHLDEKVYVIGETTAAVGTAFAFLSLIYACCKWTKGFAFILLVHFVTAVGYAILILGMMFDIQKALARADRISVWSLTHLPNMWVFVFSLAACGAIFHVLLLAVGCIYCVKSKLQKIIDDLEKQLQAQPVAPVTPAIPTSPVYPESVPQYYYQQAQPQPPQPYMWVPVVQQE